MFSLEIPILPAAEASAAQQRAFLVEIASTIDQFRKYLEQLQDMQRGVEETLAAVKYPVLTLPNEITSRIFAACLPSDGHVRPSRSAAPLLLAQICRHWREVALWTCQLWSSIYEHGSDGSVLLLETWSTRAKGHPLSLTFHGRGHKLRHESIQTISSQLGELELLGVPREQVRQLPPFPNLWRLELDTEGFAPQDAASLTEGDVLRVLNNTPRLQELTLFTLSIRAIPSLASLTSLEVTQATELTTFLRVLTQIPLLSHVNFSLKPTTEVASPPITLPQLRSLALKQEYTEDVSGYTITHALTLLTLPNLERLRIDGPLDLGVLLSLVSRSSCTLDYLAVDFRGCSPEQHLECLRAFPSLTTLHISLGVDVQENNELLISLKSTLPTLLPQLETMSIFVSEHTIDYILLIQMLQSRRALHAAALRSFQLKFEEVYNPDCGYLLSEPWPPRAFEGEELARLIAGGLEFSIDFNGTVWPED
ncbi:hypothetical protein B0H16DRAFT_1538749 [Mycena metata]|uniref:F-box domain-containing protein n=1 Tax=Mycena metata TaxID=1033252 RepID=A0AAD7J450_9AGAR|nr:hypothetical protein B0H16DRAFT_1538749 [Mycena metata]